MAKVKKGVTLEQALEPITDKILEVARMCKDLTMPEHGSVGDDHLFYELRTAIKAVLHEQRTAK